MRPYKGQVLWAVFREYLGLWLFLWAIIMAPYVLERALNYGTCFLKVVSSGVIRFCKDSELPNGPLAHLGGLSAHGVPLCCRSYSSTWVRKPYPMGHSIKRRSKHCALPRRGQACPLNLKTSAPTSNTSMEAYVGLLSCCSARPWCSCPCSRNKACMDLTRGSA